MIAVAGWQTIATRSGALVATADTRTGGPERVARDGGTGVTPRRGTTRADADTRKTRDSAGSTGRAENGAPWAVTDIGGRGGYFPPLIRHSL
eukprot:7164395-Prymnesium_polylepis.1